MTVSNYPPGMSRRDMVRGGIIEPHSHEHEWGMHDDSNDDPIQENGAFIFHERCRYSEGRYGEKYQCEETRSYRFDYSRLVGTDGEVIDLPTISDWEDIDESVQRTIEEIEIAFHDHGPGEVVEWDVDPDPKEGQVVLYYDGFKLMYEP